MKGTIDIRRVATPARQRLVASRKRTLRRRCVSTARSVWSGPRSCVIECRNLIVGAFLLDPGGAVLRRRHTTVCGTARPASESGAEGRVDVPGTWESLYLPVAISTGLGRSRKPTSLAVDGVSAVAAVKLSETGRVPVDEWETSRRGSDTGRLSRLIVAFENRVTFSGGSR